MRRYAVGAAIVVAVAGYMARAWPPHEVVAAIRSAPPNARAIGLGAVALAYAIATRPIADHLLASRRLAYWWHFPLSRGHWMRLHLRHLGVLHAGVVAVVSAGFGLRPAALAWSLLAFTVLVVAHVSATAWRDRGPAAWLGVVAAIGLGAAIVATQSPTAAAAAGVLLVPAAWRCGRPFPEPRARPWLPRLLGGGPLLAMLRLYALVLLRRHRLPLVVVVLVQAIGMAAVDLGTQHVGATEPDAASALACGVAATGAALAAALSGLASHSISGDRAWLDAWGVQPGLELTARSVLGVLLAAPSLVVIDAAISTLAVSVVATSTVVLLGARPLRALLVVALVLVVTVMLGAAAPLVVAPGFVAGAHWALRRRARARRRFETYRVDDDHD